MDWSAEFEPQGMPGQDVTTLLQGLYQQGIDRLRQLTTQSKKS